MRPQPVRFVLATLCTVLAWTAGASRADAPGDPVRVRPATLASSIEQFAGVPVEVLGGRAVRVFGPRALMIERAARFTPFPGHRDRLLILIDGAEIGVEPRLLLGSIVRVTGTARTLLGAQLSGEVPWPLELSRDRLDRLEIRAAVLATSLRTAEGIDVTRPAPSASRR